MVLDPPDRFATRNSLGLFLVSSPDRPAGLVWPGVGARGLREVARRRLAHEDCRVVPRLAVPHERLRQRGVDPRSLRAEDRPLVCIAGGRRRRGAALGMHHRRVRTLDFGALARVTGRSELLAAEPLVSRSIRLRRPYIDPLSHIQVRFLARLRSLPDDHPDASASGASCSSPSTA